MPPPQTFSPKHSLKLKKRNKHNIRSQNYKRIAIVGDKGSGKTSLFLRLLFYDLEELELRLTLSTI